MIIKAIILTAGVCAFVVGGIYQSSDTSGGAGRTSADRNAGKASTIGSVRTPHNAGGVTVTRGHTAMSDSAAQASNSSAPRAQSSPAASNRISDRDQRAIAQAAKTPAADSASSKQPNAAPEVPRTRTAPAAVAAITPDPVEAGIRAKVNRTRADMRSMATALESYYVDCNNYPLCDAVENMRKLSTGEPTVPCFRGSSLTTPIAYLTTLYPDPFAPEKQPFAYFAVPGDPKKPNELVAWILFSPGPDGRFDLNYSAYDGKLAQPQPWLLHSAYDPTNGIVSGGDIWRIKQ